jgi:hypothetical protein
VIFIPLIAFHSARVRDPGDFEEKSFRNKEMENAKGIQMVMGKLKGEDTMTVQAYRFPKENYTEKEANAWIKDPKHKVGKVLEFAPAKDEPENEPKENASGYHTACLGDPSKYTKFTSQPVEDGIELISGTNNDTGEEGPQSYKFDAAKFNEADVKKYMKQNKIKAKFIPAGTPLQVNESSDLQADVKDNAAKKPKLDDQPVQNYPEIDPKNSGKLDTPLPVPGEEPTAFDTPEYFKPGAKPDSTPSSTEAIQPTYDMDKAKQSLLDHHTTDGKISKQKSMKWFLDVDGGDAQSPDNYRLPIGKVVENKVMSNDAAQIGKHVEYDDAALNNAWEHASGKHTGIANRLLQKKVVLIKQREKLPLNDSQQEFTQRHMSVWQDDSVVFTDTSDDTPELIKLNFNCPEAEKSGSGKGACGGDANSEKTSTHVMSESPKKYYGAQKPKDLPTLYLEQAQKMDKSSLEYHTYQHEKAHDEAKTPEMKEAFKKNLDVLKQETSARGQPEKTSHGDSWSSSHEGHSKQAFGFRRMSAFEDDTSPGGIALVEDVDIKQNAAPAGSKIIREDDQVIEVPVIPMREGVFTGTDGIPTLKQYEHFAPDAHWLEGQPILKGHTGPTELVTYKHDRIGKLVNVQARPDHKDVVAVARYYKDKLSPEDLTRIKSGTPYDGSIAYTTHTSMTDGDYNGSKYNAVEDGGYHFYHFAEVSQGACSVDKGCGFMLDGAKQNGGPGSGRHAEGVSKKEFISRHRDARTKHTADISKDSSGKFIVETDDGQIQAHDKYKDAVSSANSYATGNGLKQKQNGAMKTNANYWTAPVKSHLILLNQQLEASKKQFADTKDPEAKMQVQQLTAQIASWTKQLAKLNPEGSKMNEEINQNAGGKVKDADGNECMFFEMKDKKCPVDKETKDTKKITKKNSRFSHKGNSMTEIEETQMEAPEMVVSDEIVQKMNAQASEIETLKAESIKLNAAVAEAKTAFEEAKTVVADLVAKQNAAEKAATEAKAAKDFNAFRMSLNQANRTDELAQKHYEGFKENGWSYFDANPGILRVEAPKMKAMGVPASDGATSKQLEQARAELRKTQATPSKRLGKA